MSEGGQSSVVSTPSTGSGHSSVSNQNSRHHNHGGALSPPPPLSPAHLFESHSNINQSVTSLQYAHLGTSPTHNGYVSGGIQHHNYLASANNIQQSSISLNAFETDFPLGTIKRKPSVPKIPLTNTTRNLALQSEDALLEVNENYFSSNNIGLDCVGINNENNTFASINDEIPNQFFGNGGNSLTSSPSHGDFVSSHRATLKTAITTIRRSTTDERLKTSKIQIMTDLQSPVNYNHHHQQATTVQLPSPPPQLVPPVTNKSDSDDDLPPPPPPLCESESVHSLNNSFPPTPSLEMSDINNALSPNQYNQHHILMTPQPQPKNPANTNRLSRRLSDLSPNSPSYLSYRHTPSFSSSSSFPDQTHQHHSMLHHNSMAANSRASIATPTADLSLVTDSLMATSSSCSSSNLYSPQTGFVTLKPYHSRATSGFGLMNLSPSVCGSPSSKNSRFHRQLTLDLHSWNKYGTAPRGSEPFMAQLAHHYNQYNQSPQQQQSGVNELFSPTTTNNTYETHLRRTFMARGNYGTPSTPPQTTMTPGINMDSVHFKDNDDNNNISQANNSCGTTLAHYHSDVLNNRPSNVNTCKSPSIGTESVYGSGAATTVAVEGGEKINEMMTQHQQQQYHSHGIPPPSHYGIPPSKTSAAAAAAAAASAPSQSCQFLQQPSKIAQNGIFSHARHMAISQSQIDHNYNNLNSGNVISPKGINNSSGVMMHSAAVRLAPLSTPPPPPHQPQQSTPSLQLIQLEQAAITSAQSNKNENIIYMSISPHLLQKHQQMQKQHQQLHNHYQSDSSLVYYSGGQKQQHQQPSSPSSQTYQVPPEQIFLKNMERVMQKKWHVAQMLRQDSHVGATPGQVLGFRDPAYLPPPDQVEGSAIVGLGSSVNYVSPHPQYNQTHQDSHQILPPPPPPSLSAPSSSLSQYQYHQSADIDENNVQQQICGSQQQHYQQQTKIKTVRIADGSPTVFGCEQTNLNRNNDNLSQQQIYCMGNAGSHIGAIYYPNNNKKIPPLPPRRSENTHLTNNNNNNNIISSSSSSRL